MDFVNMDEKFKWFKILLCGNRFAGETCFVATSLVGFLDHPHQDKEYPMVHSLLSFACNDLQILWSWGLQISHQVWDWLCSTLNFWGAKKHWLITCWGFGCWNKIPPNYQELQSKDVPKAKKDDVQVIFIASESLGVKSLVFTYTPTLICIWISPCSQVLSFINWFHEVGMHLCILWKVTLYWENQMTKALGQITQCY